MLLLPNGCKSSQPQVSPKNWRTQKASTFKKWYIHYRFYDPSLKSDPKTKGKIQVIIKGMNELVSVVERRQATEALLNNEISLLKQGYNPILKRIVQNLEVNSSISPFTPAIKALDMVLAKITCVPKTRIDIKSVIKGTRFAFENLGLDQLPVSQITRKHIKAALEVCQQTNPRWSPRRHNMYKAYLMKLFKELIEMEILEVNPLREIASKKLTKKIRRTLTIEERAKIDQYLKTHHYNLWRFMEIFFHSGARFTEIMNVKKDQVDLKDQRFQVLIRKGHEYRWVWKTIKDLALPLWKEVCADAGTSQFLFSKFLKPGNSAIRPDQPSRKWTKIVKKQMGIDVDFYSLKHTNTSEIVDQMGEQEAAALNSHTTTAMVVNIYDVNKEKRNHEKLKKANNKFA